MLTTEQINSYNQKGYLVVENAIPVDKLKAFDNLASIFWEFVTGEIPEEHSFKYGRLWIDALVILAIRFRPYYFYDE